MGVECAGGNRGRSRSPALCRCEAQIWLYAAGLVALMRQSPFGQRGFCLFSAWFYREMGAKMPSSVFLRHGGNPEFGENVSIASATAVVLGTPFGPWPGNHSRPCFDRDGAVLDLRCLIFPRCAYWPTFGGGGRSGGYERHHHSRRPNVSGIPARKGMVVDSMSHAFLLLVTCFYCYVAGWYRFLGSRLGGEFIGLWAGRGTIADACTSFFYLSGCSPRRLAMAGPRW